jgi:hypothetical protein
MIKPQICVEQEKGRVYDNTLFTFEKEQKLLQMLQDGQKSDMMDF